MLTSSEGKGSGVQWATLFTGDSPDDPLSMGSVWIMFLVDILLYSLLISYIDKIAPGKFGVAEKFYFFLAPSYWRPGTRVSVDDGFDQVQVEDPSMFEAEPKQKAGIRVNNLKKEFRKVRYYQPHLASSTLNHLHSIACRRLAARLCTLSTASPSPRTRERSRRCSATTARARPPRCPC